MDDSFNKSNLSTQCTLLSQSSNSQISHSDSLIHSKMHLFNLWGWFNTKGIKDISLKLIKKRINHLDLMEICADFLNNPCLPRNILFKLLSLLKVCKSFKIDSSVFQKLSKHQIKNKLHKFSRTVKSGNIIEHFPYLNINKQYKESTNLNMKFLYNTINVDYICFTKLLSDPNWQIKLRKIASMNNLKHLKIVDDKYLDYADENKLYHFSNFPDIRSLSLHFRSNSSTPVNLFSERNAQFWSKVTRLSLQQYIGDKTHILDSFMIQPEMMQSLKVFEFRDSVTKYTDITSLGKLQNFPALQEVKLNLHGFDSNLFDTLVFPVSVRQINVRLAMSGFSRLPEVLKGKKLFEKLAENNNLRDVTLIIYFMTTTFYSPDNDKREIINYFTTFLNNITPELSKLSLICSGNEDYFANQYEEDDSLLTLISTKFRKLTSLSLIIPQFILRHLTTSEKALKLDSLALSLIKYPPEMFSFADPKHLTINIPMKDALEEEYWNYFQKCMSQMPGISSLEIQFASKSLALWKPKHILFRKFVQKIIENFSVSELSIRIPPMALLFENLKTLKSVVEDTKTIRRFILNSNKYTMMRQGPLEDVILTQNL